MTQPPALPAKLLRRLRLCRRCELWRTRKCVVPGRGDVPADILFLGEGPGRAENLRGLAFCGPTLRILDAALAAARRLAKGAVPKRFFYGNVVCCRPCDGKREPNRPPTGKEAWACQGNLRRVADVVRAKRVVFLGNAAEHFCRALFPLGQKLRHPAFLLRKGGISAPEFRAFIAGLVDIFEGMR